MARYQIILNPASNKGVSAEMVEEVRAELDRYSLDYEIVQTEYPGHALELAQQAVKAGFDVVVAAGGDGTANEVVNGLMFAKENGKGTAAIGVLPIGRGNDFNFGMGNVLDWRDACRILAEGKKQWIDVGRLAGGLFPEGRYFGNSVGVGFDAVVGFIAAKQKISGFLGYLVAAIRTMFAYSPAPVVAVELEEETLTQPALMVTVMNGRRQGGGFMMAPEGDPSDGIFDLCVAHEVSKLKIFYLISKFMAGTQYGHPAVQGRRTRKLTIRAVKGSLPIHADGETISTGCDQLEVEILPRQLEMYLPEKTDK